MIKLIKSLIREYGMGWTINRSLYYIKLRMMTHIPQSEYLFEKKATVKRINLFDFDVSAIEDFLVVSPKREKNKIVEIADKAINGVIMGFSAIELDYGNPINWHLNPITGAENDKDAKWFKIPDFDPIVGDIKVIWEASRFTHFFYFARAYLITKDEKYYYAFSNQLKDWLKSNPYSYGSNYKCGQECSLRMVSALMVFSVFKNYGLTTKDDENWVSTLVRDSYKKVRSNFFYAHKCIQNNHTFSEILGLIIGGWCCQDARTVKKGYRLLDKEIKNQFEADGGYKQYSFNYHRFTLQIIECINKITEKTGFGVPRKEMLRKSALLLYQLQADNGDVPNYGSNDGALIFPVTSCDYRDFRPVINTIYALIEGKRLYKPGSHDEELLWFGSKDLLESEIEVIKKESTAFSETGYFSLRHEKGFVMICLQDYKSRPAHMDQLHIDLWHRNVNVFCDNGTYSYASEIGRELSLTGNHNTIKIPDIEQMDKLSPFLITNWTKRKNVQFLDGQFIGTMVSVNGYTHTRIVKREKWGYLIEDRVKADKEYCEINFYTPCEVKLTLDGFELFDNKVLVCTVLTESPIEIKKTYRSLYYLTKAEINRVTATVAMKENKCNIVFSICLHG